MESDLAIAQRAQLKPITEVAAGLGLEADDLELYGRFKAKIHLDVLQRLRGRPNAKYIVVTAITPTSLGEGKSTTVVGLGQALNKIGKRGVIAIRQASQGPVFGIKGGAAGGGMAQVVPMEDLNLHLTGDFHAVAAAHNECASFLDNALLRGGLDIDAATITWRRVLDVNDRGLRRIEQGLGEENELRRETGFDITAASEVMAILALSTSLPDLRARMGRIFLAQTRSGEPVTAEGIGVAGLMTVLMRDALAPNLLQTLENTPALVHAGPFGNIARGNSSVLADLIGIKLGEYLVTEAGFGADLGAEKFFNIKCRASGLKPDAAVLVATIRALKAHSGRFRVVAGHPLPPELLEENLEALRAGLPNLEKQIENVRLHGVPVVVAVNRFPGDTDAEIELVKAAALAAGADEAVESDVWARGGEGGVEMAQAVVRVAAKGAQFKPLYELDLPIKDKIAAIATRVYGASQVEYGPLAERAIASWTRLGFDKLPICMAKTHLSLSGDAALVGRPRDFSLHVHDVRASTGAGFLYPLIGQMNTMPGLSSSPGGLKVDIDEEGRIVGLN